MAQERPASVQNQPIPLNINDRVQVMIRGAGEEEPVSYLSRVEDISGTQICLGWPTSQGTRVSLREDDTVRLFFIKDAVYLLECRIIGRILSPLPMVVVQSQVPVRKAQRREYVRVAARVDVRLSARVVRFQRERRPDPVDRIEAKTLSLSGAGFALRYGSAPGIGSLYSVKLSLPDGEEPLSVNARIVRCDAMMGPQGQAFHCVGFAFTRIRESDRRRIVSFVFRTQQQSSQVC